VVQVNPPQPADPVLYFAGDQRGHVAGTFYHHRPEPVEGLLALLLEYLPPHYLDILIFVGTMGLFVFLLFLFLRVLPGISIFEMRELVHHYQHLGEAKTSRGAASFPAPKGAEPKGAVVEKGKGAD